MASLSRGEREDDLALFHGMQRRDHSSIYHSHHNADPNIDSVRIANPSVFRMVASTGTVKRGQTSGEELLASDAGKTDYDWLLTPPGTPLVITGLENEPVMGAGYVSSLNEFPNLVKSLSTIRTNHLSRGSSTTSRPDMTSRMIRSKMHNSASALNRWPCPASLAASPTSRPTSRPSTPTSRPILSSSSTNTTNAIARSRTISSTSTRSAILSRSTTPLQRPSSQTLSLTQIAPVRSSSASKASSLPFRNAQVTRGSSPATRPHAWQPSTIPGFSLEPPPNLRTTLGDRSVSNSRGATVGSARSVKQASMSSVKLTLSSSQSLSSSRPGSFSSPSLGPSKRELLSSISSTTATTGFSRPRSSSSRPMASSPPARGTRWPTSPSFCSISTTSRASELVPERSRRKSCSPNVTQGRVSLSERSLSRNGRSNSDASLNGMRGARSTKMMDQMIESRRVVASITSPGDPPALQLNGGIKPTMPTLKDSSVLGRDYLPRKSIDIALWQMDIRATNGVRSLVSNAAPLALHAVRSSNVHVMRQANSLLTTRNVARSEHNMSRIRDLEDSEVGEEFSSEIGCRASPLMSSWNHDSHDYKGDRVDLMQLFHPGVEMPNYGYLDSPLVSCEYGNGDSKFELSDFKNRMENIKGSPMSAESMRLSPYSCSSSGDALSPS